MDEAAAVRLHRERLLRDGQPAEAVEAFERLYGQYRAGATGKVIWDDVRPPKPEDLLPLASLETDELRRRGESLLGRVAWIVLNGGLGTSMEMDRAKSLVPVKGGQTFLDLLARHVIEVRRRCGQEIPLLFMDSFATREDTLAALAPYGLGTRRGGGPLPLDFLQQRFPRIREEDGLPYGEADDREAWAPPGHGNLYLAIFASGVLDRLLAAGIRWAFVSNADNLGASLHPGILGCLEERGLEFAMEVTDRTPADIKGGTLVRRQGKLELLEIAQVPEGCEGAFQDADTFPVFNTNNLWIDLVAARRRLEAGGLDLPLIVNRKAVGSTPVVQLETAMGAAIRVFGRSAGIRVPRERFAPVKTTDDLLVRRSDLYLPGGASPLVPNPRRNPSLGPPVVVLDRAFYRSVQGLDARIPHPLGLLRAERLEVAGDVRFGKDVSVVGSVQLTARPGRQLEIEDGRVLGG